MTGELQEGTRTLIVRDGEEFELPEPHTISLYEGDGTYVVLDAPGGGGSLYAVNEVQERGDAIVVRLGDEIGRNGYASAGDVVPEVTGYPFPTARPDRRLGRMVDLT
jgi:hypothetical protein